MTDPLDAAPVDRMAYAFTPPAHIREHEELNELFEEIVERMRREAEGIPLETNQLLLLSQIATDFVEMKYRDETGWQGTNARKDAKAQWISLMAEWRQVLKDNKEKISEQIVADFIKITNEAMKKVKDNDDRKTALRFMKEQFAAKGY
jgi:hypothetical protein